jgi:hypothetical protein
MTDEEIKHLILKANQLGLKGVKVKDWIPPQNATDNPEGIWLGEPHKRNSDPTKSFD